MAVRMMGGSWWIDVRFEHRRYRKRSPENSKTGAQAYEAVLRQRLARGEMIDAVAKAERRELAFAEFAQRWFDEYVASNNKYSERKAKQYILSASLVPFFGRTPVGQITTQHVEQYKAAQIKSGISNKTINNRLTVLNKCLQTAHDWLELSSTAPKVKKLKCGPVATDYLTPEESALLLTQATGVLHEMLLTTLRTGLRQGELKALQWEAINWENNTLTVCQSWNDDLQAFEPPKSNRMRVIPLNIEVCSILARRRRDSGFVFLDEDDTPFSGARLNARLAALCRKAGLRRVTWHVLRHSFATHLTMQGVAPNTVQSLLGHATITTTMRYAHVPPSALRDAVSLLDPNAGPSKTLGSPWATERDPASAG